MARLGTVVLALLFAAFSLAEDVGLLLGVREKDGRLSTVWVARRGVATFARNYPGSIRYWRDRVMWQFEESGDSVVVRAPGIQPNVLHGEMPTRHRLVHLYDGVIGLREERGDLENFEMLNVNVCLSMLDLLKRADVGPLGLTGGWNPEVPKYTMTRKEGSWWFGSTSGLVDPKAPIVPIFRSRGSSNPQVPGALAWKEVIRAYAEAIDFAASEKTDIAAIVTNEGVFVHRTYGTSLANRVQRVTMAVAAVLSVQWIEAHDIDKVLRAIEKK